MLVVQRIQSFGLTLDVHIDINDLLTSSVHRMCIYKNMRIN